MLRVLSTKILDKKLVAAAHEMGIELDCIDVIEARALDFDKSVLESNTYDAIVFTSINAVKAVTPLSLGEGWGVRRVYAVSGKTKNELEKNGIVPMAVADSAEQLADKIVSEGIVKSVFHISGNLRLDILERKLEAAGISYKELVAYETTLLDNEVDVDYDAVMFYSPSGVESFLTKNKLNCDTLYCCIGETTAGKLKSIDESINIVVAKQPTPEAMLNKINEVKHK